MLHPERSTLTRKGGGGKGDTAAVRSERHSTGDALGHGNDELKQLLRRPRGSASRNEPDRRCDQDCKRRDGDRAPALTLRVYDRGHTGSRSRLAYPPQFLGDVVRRLPPVVRLLAQAL